MHSVSFVCLKPEYRQKHKMCVSFLSATFVQSIVHVGKYLLGYARLTYRNICGHKICPV
jgi:hypothetical protein